MFVVDIAGFRSNIKCGIPCRQSEIRFSASFGYYKILIWVKRILELYSTIGKNCC